MSAPQKIEREIKKNAIIKGLLLGVVVTALSIFSFYFITTLTTTPWLIVAGPVFFSFILPLFIIILFSITTRKKIGGYWTFRQAVTFVFTSFLVCYAVLFVGRDILFVKLKEPEMREKIFAVKIKGMESSLKTQHAPDSVIKKQLNELRKAFTPPAHPSLFDVVSSHMNDVILLFVVAIIVAALLKKEPPYIINDEV